MPISVSVQVATGQRRLAGLTAQGESFSISSFPAVPSILNVSCSAAISRLLEEDGGGAVRPDDSSLGPPAARPAFSSTIPEYTMPLASGVPASAVPAATPRAPAPRADRDAKRFKFAFLILLAIHPPVGYLITASGQNSANLPRVGVLMPPLLTGRLILKVLEGRMSCERSARAGVFDRHGVPDALGGV